MDTLEAVEQYTNLGWFIFPMVIDGSVKKPLTGNGSAPRWQATNDPAKAKKTFQHFIDRFGDRVGIGLACGESEILALDLDVKGGKNGLAFMEAMDMVYEGCLTGFKASTPSGGVHFLYRNPGNLIAGGNAYFGDAHGVDVKADGGYLVLPPTMNPNFGKRYEFERNLTPDAIPEIPEALVSALAVRSVNEPHNLDRIPVEHLTERQREEC